MKPTLSIGIPAYNEAFNIGELIHAIFSQNIKSANLLEIVVVSDASTDDTDVIVKNINDKRIRLVRHNSRMGGTTTQNTIMENVGGEILAVLDADILPGSDSFIDSLIAPIIKNRNIGLTSCWLIPAEPVTFIEKVLARNHEFKRDLYMSIGDGNNIYTCFGPARALSKNLYKDFIYPSHPPVDAYSFMACVTRSMNFVFVKPARVFFRCPSNLADHIKQSTRFILGRKGIIDYFGDRALEVYYIPKLILIKMSLKEFILHPILFSCFLMISLYVRFVAYFRTLDSCWDVSVSSKKVLKS